MKAYVNSIDRKQLHEDFFCFAQKQIDCLDYDPFHPVILELLRSELTGYDEHSERAVWLSLLYMAYYNMGSAWFSFEEGPDPSCYCEKQLPVETQRRNLSGWRIFEHLDHLKELHHYYNGGIVELLTEDFTDDPEQNWPTLQENLRSIWGNGRWACYTTGELLCKVNGLNATPTDIGNVGSSGPRAGLLRLNWLASDTNSALDRCAKMLLDEANERLDVSAVGYVDRVDYAMLESLLCDFNSLVLGRYYVGRDIDRMQWRILKAEDAIGRSALPVWKARVNSLNAKDRGESPSGSMQVGVKWIGIDKDRLTRYMLDGEIPTREEP